MVGLIVSEQSLFCSLTSGSYGLPTDTLKPLDYSLELTHMGLLAKPRKQVPFASSPLLQRPSTHRAP